VMGTGGVGEALGALQQFLPKELKYLGERMV
jgi:hypothetical protein